MGEFVFNIWIVGPDNKMYWYSQSCSSYYAERRADMFKKETPAELYNYVLITMIEKRYATWDNGKEYNPKIFKKLGTIYVAEE